MWKQLLEGIRTSNKGLARAISFVENEGEDYELLLAGLSHRHASKIIGVTGPPGAGKSTLVDGLIGEMINENKKVAVLCVDPSSPFHMGAVLGDRIRMSNWYTHPQVFIRSLAARGSMGGLNPKIIEISEVTKEAGFDYIIVETVGVGQSEIEISGLADVTVVVVVPEAGDEVQTMKAGLMEIADLFVVNKSDRPDADSFVKNLLLMLAPAFSATNKEVGVIKTIAHEKKGLPELYTAVKKLSLFESFGEKKLWLYTERAYQLIQKKRMKDVQKETIKKRIEEALKRNDLNLYELVGGFF